MKKPQESANSQGSSTYKNFRSIFNNNIITQNQYLNTYKNKFHNFEETFTQYTSEELDRIIEKSQKEKFK
ncbi:hypothetical protein [Romboutsia sp. 1001713B170131_170501_G6]|uniref:hypothetical protein n=1 Tax=Romboutsia sp. 1001713B170131_170501_G6 TaxID=2787108 RepID=UPI001FAD88A0|nr:hypothetical protein [Romboutsia sp. 1001713B170131_170501_G6]